MPTQVHLYRNMYICVQIVQSVTVGAIEPHRAIDMPKQVQQTCTIRHNSRKSPGTATRSLRNRMGPQRAIGGRLSCGPPGCTLGWPHLRCKCQNQTHYRPGRAHRIQTDFRSTRVFGRANRIHACCSPTTDLAGPTATRHWRARTPSGHRHAQTGT